MWDFNKNKNMGKPHVEVKGIDFQKVIENQRHFVQGIKMYFHLFNEGKIVYDPSELSMEERDKVHMFVTGYQLGREVQRQLGDNDAKENTAVDFMAI